MKKLLGIKTRICDQLDCDFDGASRPVSEFTRINAQDNLSIDTTCNHCFQKQMAQTNPLMPKPIQKRVVWMRTYQSDKLSDEFYERYE